MEFLTEQIVSLASELISRSSVSPEDAGCQSVIADALEAQGFIVTPMPFGKVRNFWATHGTGAPVVVFAGHTDVVPSGPPEAWRYDPFTPTLDGTLLYGRGSADMKGSLAAMVAASEHFLADHPDHPGTLAYLITSDEEADAVDGTVRVVEWLAEQNIAPDFCIVGEPSSRDAVGDVVRIGRRGSLNGTLTIHGVQGHVAYPDQATNPIHRALASLQALTAIRWDEGNEAFPPTSLQISNIHAGTGATNVIPGKLEVRFNLRFSTEQSAAGIEARVTELLDDEGLDYHLEWQLSGEPFLTATAELIDAVSESIQAEQSFRPELSTGGGTSDGRFIARLGTAIVELGPVNATIHSVDEHTDVEELAKLSRIYRNILRRLLVGSAQPDRG